MRGEGGAGVWNFLKGVIMYLNSPWDGTETLKDGYISRFAFKSGPLLFDGLFFSSFFLYFCNVSIFTSLGHFFKISFAILYPLSILKESVDWKDNIKICNLEHGIFIRSPIHSYFNVFYILNFLSGLSQNPKRLRNMLMGHSS